MAQPVPEIGHLLYRVRDEFTTRSVLLKDKHRARRLHIDLPKTRAQAVKERNQRFNSVLEPAPHVRKKFVQEIDSRERTGDFLAVQRAGKGKFHELPSAFELARKGHDFFGGP